MSKAIVAVDLAYAKKLAYSVWKDGELVEVGKATPKGFFPVLERYNPEIVAVEVPYLKKNPKTYERLSRALGVIQFAAEQTGSKLLTVHPSSWQSKILPIRPHARRPERLHWTKVIGEGIAGRELDADEAAAVCIGQYVSGRVR